MKKRGSVVLGVLLCVLTLTLSVVLQKEGYLTYLNSDMASEVILAKRQVDTHSLVQMDWIYSTEVHLLHMNLFYAVGFLFTSSYFLARVIGNVLGFLLGMGTCVYLIKRLGITERGGGAGLITASLLPLAASTLYASNMTIGGYYIIHIPFAFMTAGLWLSAGRMDRTPRETLPVCIAFVCICLLEGLLSVRYMLCFICPMVVVSILEAVKPQEKPGKHTVWLTRLTIIGFVAALLGFAAAEILVPRLFFSGVGAASSFVFNPLDGEAMAQAALTIFADFLKLLGWRGNVPLFSAAGIVNGCVAGVLFLGIWMALRVYRRMDEQDARTFTQKRMMRYALAAFGVNVFCFVFIKGAYLNRYLILAVLFLVPVLAIVVTRERNAYLRRLFLLLLSVQLGLSAMLLLADTREQEIQARERGRDMMEAASFLQEEGYTHGYGTFWNVRVMQERTQGALTFTGVVPVETEEGAASDVSLDMIRWLEPDEASDLDICPGKTFLLLTKEEEEQLSPWLALTGAPQIYENDTFTIYGFGSSQEFVGDMLWGKMKLEHASLENGAWRVQAGGRMRVPTTWREAGSYVLRFTCEGSPAEDSVVQLYTTREFTILEEQKIASGENEISFTLNQDDKYFMILIRGGAADELVIRNLQMDKQQP